MTPLEALLHWAENIGQMGDYAASEPSIIDGGLGHAFVTGLILGAAFPAYSTRLVEAIPEAERLDWKAGLRAIIEAAPLD